MFIHIVRHAWAGHFGDPQPSGEPWPDDSLRPLSPEGRTRFETVVKRLAKRGFAPEIIATSPYARCRQTADIIAENLPNRPKPEIVELEALTPGSDVPELFRWTAEQDVSSVCWVGHAPDVGFITAALLGDHDVQIRFAKGACAAVRLEGSVGPGAGEFRWLATAKMLGC